MTAAAASLAIDAHGFASRKSTLSLWRRALAHRSTLIGAGLIAMLLVVTVPAPLLTPYDPVRGTNPQFLPPLTGDHYFGTTASGRDLFSAIAHGGRVSLAVGFSVAALSTLIGTAVGSVAGYAGKWTGDVLMRLTEFFLVMPSFFVALVVLTIFGRSVFHLVGVLAVLSWPPTARVIRAEYLSLKEREFVQAAKLLGSPASRIILREILPNAIRPAIVMGSLQVSQAILSEASLSFLGLGDPNLASWGALLVDAQQFVLRAPWAVLLPGLAIAAAVVGFNLLGDGLAFALNPRTGGRSG